MIKLQDDKHMTTRAVDALLEATGLIVKEYRNQDINKWVYNLNGQEFTSKADLGRALLASINEWMLACGLVKEAIILKAHMAGRPHSKFFTKD